MFLCDKQYEGCVPRAEGALEGEHHMSWGVAKVSQDVPCEQGFEGLQWMPSQPSGAPAKNLRAASPPLPLLKPSGHQVLSTQLPPLPPLSLQLSGHALPPHSAPQPHSLRCPPPTSFRDSDLTLLPSSEPFPVIGGWRRPSTTFFN